MKVISWNVNGIRAVERKGDLDRFLSTHAPDIFFLQEIKATPAQLSEALREHPEYHQFYNPADKPGYAGTGVWLKKGVCGEFAFATGMDGYDDREGRICRLDFDDWTLFGVYFPNGGKSTEAWQEKLKFYDAFLEHLVALRAAGRRVIFMGDINCAHEEIDLARPKENRASIGFLPEERAWYSRVIAAGFWDVFRVLNPDARVYSWWHMLSGARARGIGWRIDAIFVDLSLLPQVRQIAYLGAQMGSDHCPVAMEFDFGR